MRTPFLKYFMLKVISEGKTTGYRIIKRCEEVLGYTPSTGSIYPLLKGMEKEKIIKGKKEGRSTVYSITEKGKRMLEEGEKLREEIHQKLSRYASSVAETFGDSTLKNMLDKGGQIGDHGKFPVVFKIRATAIELEKKGVDGKKIRKILDRAYRNLLDLKRDKNERNK